MKLSFPAARQRSSPPRKLRATRKGTGHKPNKWPADPGNSPSVVAVDEERIYVCHGRGSTEEAPLHAG